MTLAEVPLAALQPIADVWTTDDLEDIPSGVRAEVHNGKLVIMPPARLWRQDVGRRICNLLEVAGRNACTQVGVYRVKHDVRVAGVGVFHEAPTDPEQAWHEPNMLALVAELWFPSPGEKVWPSQWYANVGIPEYWLAEPIEEDRWGALITMYELVRSASGVVAYVETRRTTLATLERSGLG